MPTNRLTDDSFHEKEIPLKIEMTTYKQKWKTRQQIQAYEAALPGIMQPENEIGLKYSCNNITTTWIQISRQNWNVFYSNASHQIII